MLCVLILYICGETMSFRLKKYSSHWFHCHIKGKAKQATELVKVQSVLCEEAVYLQKIIVVWRSPLQWSDEQLPSNFYYLRKTVQRGITNKSIVINYIKFWIMAERIVRIIKNLINTKHKFIYFICNLRALILKRHSTILSVNEVVVV